jgi:hypothetical protein
MSTLRLSCVNTEAELLYGEVNEAKLNFMKWSSPKHVLSLPLCHPFILQYFMISPSGRDPMQSTLHHVVVTSAWTDHNDWLHCWSWSPRLLGSGPHNQHPIRGTQNDVHRDLTTPKKGTDSLVWTVVGKLHYVHLYSAATSSSTTSSCRQSQMQHVFLPDSNTNSQLSATSSPVVCALLTLRLSSSSRPLTLFLSFWTS